MRNPPDHARVSAESWLVLGLLLLSYMLNFIDRQIVSILATPIKTSLSLTDTQLGLLGGTAFAVLYTTVGIPIASRADRWNRVRIVAGAVAAWSLFTGLCGLAHSFWQLFLARLGVGLGEAGGVAPSHSLIGDYFPMRLRATALGIYSLGVPIGSALGIYFGGWIAVTLGWRWAFIIASLVGIPLALILLVAVKEPLRGRLESTAPPRPAMTLRQGVAQVAAIRSFWLLSAGSAAAAIPFNGIMFWLPSLFERHHGLSPAELPAFIAPIVLIGGCAGLFLGGVVADRLERWRPGASMLAAAVLVLLAVPSCFAGVWAASRETAWIMFAIAQACAMSYVGPLLASLQRIAGPSLRAMASASYLFISNLLGLGLGSLTIGAISDHIARTQSTNPLGLAIAASSLLFGVAALLMAVASRFLKADIKTE